MSLFGLRYAADIRSLVWIVWYFSHFTAMWMYSDVLSTPVWILALAWLCMLSFGGATITHNTMHCAMFERDAHFRNGVIRYALSLMYGHAVSSFVSGHNLSHHKFTQSRKDHMRTSKLRWNWNLLNLLFYHPTVAGSVLVGDIRYALIQHKLGRAFSRRLAREMSAVFIATGILLCINPYKFVLYFQVPHLFAQYCIVTVNMIQHDGCDVGTGKQGNIARNFTGAITNFLLFENGLHSIHHMRPQLHWSLLPAAHANEVEPNIHPKLLEANIVSYMFEAFVYPGQRVRYDGKPVVFDTEADEDEDEDWVYNGKSVPNDSFTVSKFLQRVVDLLALGAAKTIAPLYSPFSNDHLE